MAWVACTDETQFFGELVAPHVPPVGEGADGRAEDRVAGRIRDRVVEPFGAVELADESVQPVVHALEAVEVQPDVGHDSPFSLDDARGPGE